MRADAARNRAGLLQAASRAFAQAHDKPSMRAIAREAGVGIATLYRHFPTREALVDAVYLDQAERLTTGAVALLAELPPAAALRGWMDLFAEWLSTKQGMLGTLMAGIDTGGTVQAQSRAQMLSAIAVILRAGTAADDIRADIDAEDVAALLVGVLSMAGNHEQGTRPTHLLDVVMDGLRASGPGRQATDCPPGR